MTTLADVRPTRPAHVPEHLFWDHHLDEFTSELDDPYLAAARLHAGPDIVWARDVGFGKSCWLVTRHALMQEIYVDAERRFSSEGVMGLNELLGVSWNIKPIELDPPEHATYRHLLNPYFTPRAVAAFETEVRAICDGLIAKFEHRPTCEFISEFAIQFPTIVFLTVMGLPREMHAQFVEWDHTLWRSEDLAKRTPAARSILNYLDRFIDEQRAAPSTELMGGLLGAAIEGRALDKEELLSMCMLLYLAGLDTVYGSLGWYMRHLAGDQALQDRLRANPAEIPQAVDELLRAFSVVRSERRVREDMEFHGVRMKKGDYVTLPTYLAARDPLAFPDPHRIDIDRKPRHVAFASGAHICLGMHLARRELKIVLEAFLSRFSRIRPAEGEACRWHPGPVLGVDHLPIALERA
jgi:cytochrome P450